MKILLLLVFTILLTSCGTLPVDVPVYIEYTTCNGIQSSFSGTYQGMYAICSGGCIVSDPKDLIFFHNGNWIKIASNVCSIQLIK